MFHHYPYYYLFFSTILHHVDATSIKMDFLPVGDVRTDPIVSQTCLADHIHTFYGPQLVHPSTTYDDLIVSPVSQNTGNVRENKSLYWHPTVYSYSQNTNTYTRDEIAQTSAYYIWENGVDTKAFPNGFRMIAGLNPDRPDQFADANAECVNPSPCERADGCDTPDDSLFPRDACEELEVSMSFPTCWDGQFDSDDHQSHVHYTLDGELDGQCPASHPHRLPQIQFFFRIMPYSGGWHTFSDSTSIYHADYVSGWNETFLQEVLDNCETDSFAANPWSFCENFVTFRDAPKCTDQDECDFGDPNLLKKLKAIQPEVPFDTKTVATEETDVILGDLPRGLCNGELLDDNDNDNPTDPPVSEAPVPAPITTDPPVSVAPVGTPEPDESDDNDNTKFPPYSQQCRDDAGPPFLDDPPNSLYHDGSEAVPVLKNGECAEPVRDACMSRGSPKTAYLEGPIQCNGNGWYCRILVDENWPPQNLIADLNFGYCNETEAIEDPGWDRSGHCHGSSDDSTYYWWLRDHWFRGYNGRLRCCCDWATGPDALTAGRIVNRCDYRRLVTTDENVENCRDANEDHGLSYEGGCSAEFTQFQVADEIPENDQHCWEVNRFGHVDNDDDGPTPAPPPGDDDDEEESEDDEEEESEDEEDEESEDDEEKESEDDEEDEEAPCVDSPLPIARGKGSVDCDWVSEKADKRCKKVQFAKHCPVTCDKCESHRCEDTIVRFKVGNRRRKCRHFQKNPDKCNDDDDIKETCRESCGYCG